MIQKATLWKPKPNTKGTEDNFTLRGRKEGQSVAEEEKKKIQAKGKRTISSDDNRNKGRASPCWFFQHGGGLLGSLG